MDQVFAVLTDTGGNREHNEDAVLAMELRGGAVLLAVADGVGGGRAGEVASSGALELLSSHVASADLAEPGQMLRDAVVGANRELFARSSLDPYLRGMATTVVAAIVRSNQAWVANVGDSRAYLVRGDRITQLTEDHSWVGERAREGEMTGQEARESKARNIITRSVGSGLKVQVDVTGPTPILAGCRLLLCSDGLYGAVSEAEIAATASSMPPGEAARRLIDAANANDGPDNISVAIYAASGE